MTAAAWSLLGVLAGALLAVQAPVNAQLGRGLGLPIAAAAVSFVAGAVILCAATWAFARFEGAAPDWRAPAPWLFAAGGLLGATYVTIAVLLVPRIGAAALMAFLIAGQLTAGILLDRAGFLDLAVREISLGRIAGAGMLLGGALLIRLT